MAKFLVPVLLLVILAQLCATCVSAAKPAFCNAKAMGGNYLSVYENAKNAGQSVSGQKDPGNLATLQAYRGSEPNPLEVALKSGSISSFDFQKYGMDMVPFAAPGIAFFAITVIFCLCFGCARCCCAKTCCKPRKTMGEYTMMEKFLPVLFWLIFAIIGLAVAVTGIVSTSQFTGGIVHSVCDLDTLATDSSDMIDSLADPVAKIAAMTTSIIDQVNATVASSSDVGAQLLFVSKLLKEYVTKINNTKLKRPKFNEFGQFVGLESATSPSLQAASSNGLAISSSLDITAGATVTLLDELKTGVQTNLVTPKQLLQTLSSTASEMATMTKELIDQQLRGGADSAGNFLGPVQKYSLIFGALLFAIFLAAVPIMLVGFFLTKFGHLTNCTGTCLDDLDDVLGHLFLSLHWVLLLLGMVLMFLLAGIFIPLSVGLSDVCMVMSVLPENLDTYVSPMMKSRRLMDESGQVNTLELYQPGVFHPRETMALGKVDPVGVLKGCFNDVPLMTSLNMTSKFNFRKMIDFSQLGGMNISSSTDFSMVDSFAATVTNSSLEKWGWNETQKTTICALKGASSTECIQLGYFKNNLTETIAWMKADMKNIVGNTTAFGNILSTFFNKMISVKDLTGPLFNETDKLASAGGCKKVTDHYYALYGFICKDSLSGLLNTGLCLLLVAFIGYPMIICTVFIQIRHAGTGHDANEEEIELINGPAKRDNDFSLQKW
jgi:hypothetical protein